jgi:enoyl-CoA hydratase/carnithine racemase
MYDEILYQVEDPVATITLNRPEKLNALTDRTMQELRHALADAEAREDVVGIVLTGAGRGFCAGVDMGLLGEIQEAGEISAMRQKTDIARADPGDSAMGPNFESGFSYLMKIRKPVIAAVNGPCAGLGFSVSMFCDMRFASEDAVFTTAFAPRGLVAEHGMSWVLPRLIGPSKALDVLWTSRKIGGAAALELGLVNRVVPGDQLLQEASGFVQGLAETSSPGSLMHMKHMIYRHLQEELGEAMRDTNHMQDVSVQGPDFQEGIASFLERRAPNFPRVTVD